jgi:uncharacterized coiled-coil protein SlyX
VSPAEVEKIGLAKQADDTAETADSAEAGASRADLPKAGTSGQSAASGASEPPAQKRRIQMVMLVLLGIAVVGFALAFGNQMQRARSLETRVTFLSGELDRAHDELAAHERQMEGVRTAVSDLTERMSALKTLVNEPPRPLDAP